MAQETVDLLGVLKEPLKVRYTPHIQTQVMMSSSACSHEST
jgi:hypothetical protein